jgi:hypothetical protein
MCSARFDHLANGGFFAATHPEPRQAQAVSEPFLRVHCAAVPEALRARRANNNNRRRRRRPRRCTAP